MGGMPMGSVVTAVEEPDIGPSSYVVDTRDELAIVVDKIEVWTMLVWTVVVPLIGEDVCKGEEDIVEKSQLLDYGEG